MKLLYKGVILLFIGLYIELLKKIVSKYVTHKINKRKMLTSSLLLTLSKHCNLLSNIFLQIDENI